jgi:hypothetical protein
MLPEDPIIKARKGCGTRGINKEAQVWGKNRLSQFIE